MGTIKSDEIYSAVSLSGGKDSSCLLILMIEKGLPIDCVLYADTGMEFPEMEAHIAKLDDFLFRERGLHITTLRHPCGFEWLMFHGLVFAAVGFIGGDTDMVQDIFLLPGPLGQFKQNWSVERLEERFAREDGSTTA